MSTWTDIPHQNIEPEKPIRAMDIWAISENIKALSEGADGAPRIMANALPLLEPGNIIVMSDLTGYGRGGSTINYFILRRGRITLNVNTISKLGDSVNPGGNHVDVKINNIIVTRIPNGQSTVELDVNEGDIIMCVAISLNSFSAGISSVKITVSPNSAINTGQVAIIQR